MNGMWDKFVFEFCKVNFLCWQGYPNWLGWIVIGILAFLSLIIALAIFVAVTDDIGSSSRIDSEKSTDTASIDTTSAAGKMVSRLLKAETSAEDTPSLSKWWNNLTGWRRGLYGFGIIIAEILLFLLFFWLFFYFNR